MNTRHAAAIAEQTLREQALTGWAFHYDRALQRAGACFYRQKRISLSRPFVERNDEATVVDTLRHEIAHALAWTHEEETGHGPAWRKWCAIVGARPERCYAEDVAMPAPRYECTVLAQEAEWSVGSGAHQQSGVARMRLGVGETFGRHRLTRKLRAAVEIGLVAVYDTRNGEWIADRRPA